MKIVVLAGIFLLAIVVLISLAYSSSLPVLNLDDVRRGTTPEGNMEMRAIVTHIDSFSPLRFRVGNSAEDTEPVLVESPRSPPENFRVGIGASLRGTYDPDAKTFHAYRITTQCPSRYDAAKEYQEKRYPQGEEAEENRPGSKTESGVRGDGQA